MTSKKLWVLQGAAIALAFAMTLPASAVLVNFTVDEIGSGDGGVPIAPTSGNIGKYNAGSYIAISGSIGGSLSGIPFSGSFTAQQAASGAFSSGNPGSLLGFYTGGLNANVSPTGSTIAFPGGSTITAQDYTKLYPVKGGAASPLIPMIGGGPSTAAPGSDPANYGVKLNILALGFVSVASGNAAMRDSVLDVIQSSGIPSQALTGALGGTQNFVSKANVSAAIATAQFDYNLKGGTVLGNTVPDLIGSSPITGVAGVVTGTQAGSLKSVVVNASRQIYDLYLTVPLTSTSSQTITGDLPVTITVTTTGQVAAYALGVQLPEPATLALAGFAAVPLGLMAWRRRKTA